MESMKNKFGPKLVIVTALFTLLTACAKYDKVVMVEDEDRSTDEIRTLFHARCSQRMHVWLVLAGRCLSGCTALSFWTAPRRLIVALEGRFKVHG